MADRVRNIWFSLVSIRPLIAYKFSSAADNIKTGKKVAIKKFSRPFATAVHAKCAHRELKLLRLIKHDNVIKIVDMFTSAENAQDMNDAYGLDGRPYFNV